MSGSAEKNKRKMYKKEVKKAAHTDANTMILENKNLKANISVLHDTVIDKNKVIGFQWIALTLSWIGFISAGVLLWIS